MSVIYHSHAKTLQEFQTELMQLIEPKMLGANRAVRASKTERDRVKFMYELAAYKDIWTFLNQLTFSVAEEAPRKQEPTL